MEACKCDACGKYYKYDIKEAVKQFSLMGRLGYSVTEERYPDSRSRKLEICPDCQYKLWKMFNQEKEPPSAQTDITATQVKEYCEKRCLVVLSSDAFHRLKQAEIMWHPYPKEKPPKEDIPYLITCEYLWGEERIVMEALWGDVDGVTQWFDIDLLGNDAPLKLKVFAWAEMPEPYKENKK